MYRHETPGADPEAARLFAEKGYHGTSMGDLAQAMGVQKGSLYSLTESKQELLYETMREGAPPSTWGSMRCRRTAGREKIRLALAAPPRRLGSARDGDGLHPRVALPGGRAAERDRRGAPPVRGAPARPLPRGREHGELRTDLDEGAAALLVLSAANWAYTWLAPGRDTDELADRFAGILIDGIRGYATPR